MKRKGWNLRHAKSFMWLSGEQHKMTFGWDYDQPTQYARFVQRLSWRQCKKIQDTGVVPAGAARHPLDLVWDRGQDTECPVYIKPILGQEWSRTNAAYAPGKFLWAEDGAVFSARRGS
jgi:hypothetical protein